MYNTGIDRSRLINGLETLHSGLKMYLIAVAVIFIGMIIVVGALIGFATIASISSVSSSNPNELVNSVGWSAIILAILIIIIAGVLGFIAITRVRNGMETIAGVYRDAQIGATGAKLIYYGIILMVVGAITLLIFIGVIFLLIGGLLLLIGGILWGLGMMNLDNILQEDLKTPAIIYIIGVVLALIPWINIVGSILELVAIYLMYTRLGAEIENQRRMITQPRPSSEAEKWGF